MVESLGRCKVCGGEAGVLYPLLPGKPAFCSAHHNPHDAGPFGCDFSGPDDFDVPDREEFCWPDLTREDFLWRDNQSRKWPLHEIDDSYLQNIINFLRRKSPSMDPYFAAYWVEVMVFLEKEQEFRREHNGKV